MQAIGLLDSQCVLVFHGVCIFFTYALCGTIGAYDSLDFNVTALRI